MKEAATENLRDVVSILGSFNACKWWLEAGTCLAAVREGDFIDSDNDIDIGIPGAFSDLWQPLKRLLCGEGFDLIKERELFGKKNVLGFKRNRVRLDIFFFYEKDDFWWHGWCGPDEQDRRGEYKVCRVNIFSKMLFENLKEIEFKGKRCFIPNPSEQYLFERYGKDWRIPDPDYKYWKDCKAIDKNFFNEERVIFIGGVWDLFHVGHLNILEKCSRLGTKLVVGVLTDSGTSAYKSTPIIAFEDRLRIVEALKLADVVIEQHDTDPTNDLRELGIKPHYLVHGSDWDNCPGEDYVNECGGKLVFFPYTKAISTTDIKMRIECRK